MFWKSFSSHTHAFLFLFSMLWGVFSKIRLFFQKNIFPDFRLIQTVFRSIEILFKNLCEPLSGSIDQTYFSINRTSWIWFFKHGSWLFQKFFQVFSLSPIQTWLHLRFLLFFILSFARFLSPNIIRPFYPSFCFYFLISCIINLGILDYA